MLSTELIKELRTLGFQHRWTSNDGTECWAHPSEPEHEFVVATVMSEKKIKEWRRKAERIAGLTVDTGRHGAKAKKRADADRRRRVRAERQKTEAAAAAEKRHRQAEAAREAEAAARKREKDLTELRDIMTQRPYGY